MGPKFLFQKIVLGIEIIPNLWKFLHFSENYVSFDFYLLNITYVATNRVAYCKYAILCYHKLFIQLLANI